MTQRDLIIWVLSDGKPGHYNQSKGIVQVLESRYTCQVIWLDMHLRGGWLRSALRVLLNRIPQLLSLSLLRLFYRFEMPTPQPDMLVATGGKVSFALAWLGRALGCKTVLCGSLRDLRPDLFSLCLTISPEHQASNTLVMPVAPMPVDAEAMRIAGAQLRQQLNLASPVWLLLVGGDGAGYRYQQQDWQRLTVSMAAMSRDLGVRWLLSTSRRTGAVAEAQLKQYISEQILADAVWWAEQPRKVLMSYLGAADAVVCTADSLSMITEAVVAGRPVLAWQPEQAQPNLAYRQALQRLGQAGYLAVTQTLDASLLPERKSFSGYVALVERLEQVLAT